MITIPNYRYSVTVCIKFILLAVDMLINALSEYARRDILSLILVFIIQDLCIVFAITLLVFSFLSAFIFQSGFIGLLYKRFLTPLILCGVYLVMTIVLQVLMLTVRWTSPLKFQWPNSLLILYTFHKVFAVVHYYFYKRTILKFSDPKSFEESYNKDDSI